MESGRRPRKDRGTGLDQGRRETAGGVRPEVYPRTRRSVSDDGTGHPYVGGSGGGGRGPLSLHPTPPSVATDTWLIHGLCKGLWVRDHVIRKLGLLCSKHLTIIPEELFSQGTGLWRPFVTEFV